MAMGGEAFRNFPANTTARYGTTLDKYTHLLCEHGANDVSTDQLGTVQSNAIKYWTMMRDAGIGAIYQTTTLPQTTSTDGFATVENQTPKATEPVRLAWNRWLRDGAPTIAGEAVAVGATGLRVGQEGHLLKSIYDCAPWPSHPLTPGNGCQVTAATVSTQQQ